MKTAVSETENKRKISFGIEDILSSKFGDSPPNKIGKLGDSKKDERNVHLWPAWVYCTRYSDRPSAGPRTRRVRKKRAEKRPRTAFTSDQLEILQEEFDKHQYLTEDRRVLLAKQLKLSVSQIKVWFQNKRAKIKKVSGVRNNLATQLMAQGLYNHVPENTVPPEISLAEKNE